MEKGGKQLLILLRAFLVGKPLMPCQMEEITDNFEQILHMAKIHDVTGILAYKMREYYEINQPADADGQEIRDIVTQIYYATVQKTISRTELYKNLSEILKNAGIDHLEFKGICLRDIYTVPELRTFGDIDFVIRPEDRKRCHELMKKHKYTVRTGYEPVYTYQKNREYYEIHTSIMSVNFTDRADYIDYFNKLWENVIKKDDHVYVFTPEFHFVYLISHIAKHIYCCGAGFRMYIDLAFFIQK